MGEFKDPLDISDEDFADLNPVEVEALLAEHDAPAGDEEDTSTDDDTTTSDDTDDTSDDADDDTSVLDDDDENIDDAAPADDDEKDDETNTDDVDDTSDDNNDDAADDADAATDEDPADSDDNDPDDKDTKDDSEDKVDYKAQYEALTAPFTANGKQIQIDNVDDAIKLMQMGANYNKKMAGLKPNLKLLKMLENNKLLDEDNLSYLIDLSKKDPTAINKLIKDSGVNPMEIDVEKEHGYKTNKTYTVSDSEVDLDGILEDIKDTESFATTVDIVSNKWDAHSRQILVENPDVIKTINEHVQAGIYDKITQVVDQQRMLGKLEGMSDVDAYKYVGDAIHEAGGFDAEREMESKPAPTEKPAKKVDPGLKARKKAASSTKATTSKKKAIESYDPLSMSDEDIEKLSDSGLF